MPTPLGSVQSRELEIHTRRTETERWLGAVPLSSLLTPLSRTSYNRRRIVWSAETHRDGACCEVLLRGLR
jgi:hypothetical protein